MKGKRQYILTTLALLGAFTGCLRDTLEIDKTECVELKPIEFDLQTSLMTKAMTERTSVAGFTCFAVKEDKSVFINNVKTTTSSGKEVVSGKYWPATGSLSFFGCLPNTTMTIEQDNVTMPVGTSSSKLDGTQDYVFGATRGVSNGTSPVSLPFRHILANIAGCRFTGGKDGMTTTVSEVSISHPKYGTFVNTPSGDSWKSLGANEKTTLSKSFKSTAYPSGSASISGTQTGTSTDNISLIPGDYTVTVRYSVTFGSRTEDYEVSGTASLVAGKRSTIIGTLDNEMDFLELSVIADDWNIGNEESAWVEDDFDRRGYYWEEVGTNQWEDTGYSVNANYSTVLQSGSSSYHVNNGTSTMKVTFWGYDNFIFKIMSAGQAAYDYLVVSNLDVNTVPTAYNSTGVKTHTRNAGKTSTTAYQTFSNYTTVTFSTPDEGQHSFYIRYRKNGSTNSYADRGYVIFLDGEDEVQSLTFNLNRTTLQVDGATATATATVTATYASGRTEDVSDKVTLSSNAPTVASVSGKTVTAVDKGSATITASYEGKTATQNVTVVKDELVSATVSFTKDYFFMGEESTATVMETYSLSGTKDITSLVTLEPSASLVSIAGNKVTGTDLGDLTINVKMDGQTICSKDMSVYGYKWEEVGENQWEDTGYSVDANHSTVLQSGASSYHVNNGTSTMKVTFYGYETFSFGVMSSGQAYYDYLTVSPLDAASASASRTGAYASTYSTNKSSTTAYQTLSNYTTVSYTTDGGMHSFYVRYRKNASTNSYADRGYVIFSSNGGGNLIPQEYTAIDYIENTNSDKYVDLLYQPAANTRVQMKFRLYNHSGGTLFGNDNGGSEYDSFRFFTYSSQWYLDYGNGDGYNRIYGGSASLNTDYEIEFGNRYVKDMSTGSNVISSSTVSFSRKTYNAKLFNGITTGRIYYTKVYEDDELKLNLYPVTRNSDGVDGMYCTVTKAFYPLQTIESGSSSDNYDPFISAGYTSSTNYFTVGDYYNFENTTDGIGYVSTNHDDNSEGWIILTNLYSGNYTFAVSSEAGYDELYIEIDGTGNTISGSDSVSVYLSAGSTIYLRYTKDGSVSDGADSGGIWF